MTNDGEYPVADVGEHATQIAKILIFNGYRTEAQLVKVQHRDIIKAENQLQPQNLHHL